MSEPVDGRGREVAERIAQARFTPVRLSPGYDQRQVDDLLDRLAAAASEGRGLRSLVDSARFDQTRWREGYKVDEVDDFLAGLRASAS